MWRSLDEKSEYHSLSEAIADLYEAETSVITRQSVSGGDINRAFRLELSNGKTIFMKANRIGCRDFFRAEAQGLQAIKETGAVRVPNVLGSGTDGQDAFLLLEYVEEGRRTRNSLEILGRNLAGMHQSDTTCFTPYGRFGFICDNYIGAGEQINTIEESWISFFVQNRLLPQYRKAADWFSKEEHRSFDVLIEKLDRYLIEPERPSLLHGDLWAGNYMIDWEGVPWLIDPAVYVGHAEADLAMTELFGGFDPVFYDAYREAAGIDSGYRERRDLYNLYHLLNHLNLFGGSYLSSVRNIIRSYI